MRKGKYRDNRAYKLRESGSGKRSTGSTRIVQQSSKSAILSADGTGGAQGEGDGDGGMVKDFEFSTSIREVKRKPSITVELTHKIQSVVVDNVVDIVNTDTGHDNDICGTDIEIAVNENDDNNEVAEVVEIVVKNNTDEEMGLMKNDDKPVDAAQLPVEFKTETTLTTETEATTTIFIF